MNFKIMVIFFLLVLSIQSKSEEVYINYDNLYNFKKIKNNNHLYLKKIKDIEKVDTITYYLDSSDDNKDNLFNSFFIFAEKIGLSNGAVYLPTKKNKWKYNRISNYEYLEKSNCKNKNIFIGDTFIVFEIRKTGSCFSVPISEKQYLLPILAIITKNIENFKSLKKESNYLVLRDAMKKDLKELGVPVANISVFNIFIDYIRSIFKTANKKS